MVNWWNNLSTIAKAIITCITVIVSLSSSISAGYNWITYYFATRYYVNSEMFKITIVVIELAIEQKERLKRNRDNLINRLTIAKDRQTINDLQDLIEQANQDIIEVEMRIKRLQN